MTSLLVGVSATDPATYFTIAMLFIGMAGLACWLLARRAAQLNPMVAQRQN